MTERRGTREWTLGARFCNLCSGTARFGVQLAPKIPPEPETRRIGPVLIQADVARVEGSSLGPLVVWVDCLVASPGK
jgi:hypothetical protein